jgi:hypothetical protein
MKSNKNNEIQLATDLKSLALNYSMHAAYYKRMESNLHVDSIPPEVLKTIKEEIIGAKSMIKSAISKLDTVQKAMSGLCFTHHASEASGSLWASLHKIQSLENKLEKNYGYDFDKDELKNYPLELHTDELKPEGE